MEKEAWMATRDPSSDDFLSGKAYRIDHSCQHDLTLSKYIFNINWVDSMNRPKRNTDIRYRNPLTISKGGQSWPASLPNAKWCKWSLAMFFFNYSPWLGKISKMKTFLVIFGVAAMFLAACKRDATQQPHWVIPAFRFGVVMVTGSILNPATSFW